MKVVIAHNRYSSAQPSGENVMVDAEIGQLRDAGVEVVPFIRSSDEISGLSTAGKARLAIAPIWAPGVQRELSELLARERPDVFHLHNPYPLLSPWVVRTAHSAGVPVVQTIHNYRHVCLAATFVRDGQVCRDCVGRRFPTPAVVHSCYRGSKAQTALMATSITVHRGTWHSVDRFIALTDGIADYLLEYGIPRDRITVKPNAVADPGPASTGGRGFLYAGRLTPEKGISLLLDAWARHPDGSLGTLTFVGDGPERPLVEAAAAARSDVIFVGPLDNAGTQAAMREAAVLVAPSVWHDVLPTVIIEALANGTPVLGTNLGGIPYLVGDGGWIVAPTVEALVRGLAEAASETAAGAVMASGSAEAMAGAEAIAPAGAAGRAAAARARYLAAFTPKVVLSTLIGAYESVRR